MSGGGGAERKADELHFLLAAAQGSSARSPINRLKDADVRKKEERKKTKMKDPSLCGEGEERGAREGGWRV